MIDKQTIVVVPTRPDCKWKKDKWGRDVPVYIHGKYHYTLEEAIQYVSENKFRWMLRDVLLYNKPLRDIIRKIGIGTFLKEIKQIRPDDDVFVGYVDDLQDEWQDLKIADYDISIVAICDDVRIMGHTFHGLDDIRQSVEMSKLNTYSIDSYPNKVSYPHIGKVYESYPCFDSYDSASENRTYQNYIFRRDMITGEEINALYNLEHHGNYRRVHENIPKEMLPIIYYEGDGGYMLVATERQKKENEESSIYVPKPAKRYYFFYEENFCSVMLIDISDNPDEKRKYIAVDEINGTITLPNHVNGKKVTHIMNYFLMGTDRVISARELIVPSTYQSLGKKNFSGWNSIERIVLHCKASALREWNFAYCDNLKTVICTNAEIYMACTHPNEHIYSNIHHGIFDGCHEKINIVQE